MHQAITLLFGDFMLQTGTEIQSAQFLFMACDPLPFFYITEVFSVVQVWRLG